MGDIEGIPDDVIPTLEIPTATPLVYDLDANLQPMASSAAVEPLKFGRYLGDQEKIKAAAEAVRNQTKVDEPGKPTIKRSGTYGASSTNLGKKKDASPRTFDLGVNLETIKARYNPIVEGRDGAIKILFDKLDKNKDGMLEASELRDVVSAYTEKPFDEKQFFGWFDLYGQGGGPDGLLDLQEFSWYLADVAQSFGEPKKAISGVILKFEQIAAPGNNEVRYGATIKGNETAIEELFKKIDKNSNGFLVASELRDVVSRYSDRPFDEQQFFGWFDVHGQGGGPDGQLDQKEFGWYLADIAEGFGEPQTVITGIIQKFVELAV